MNRRMNIGTALNKKYVLYTGVMLSSLFRNNPEMDFHVYLLHQELTQEDFTVLEEVKVGFQVTFHSIRVEDDKLPGELPGMENWTKETYFRLLMTELLPEDVDRILYLDTDVIVNKPIAELYRMDFEDKKFIVCEEMELSGELKKRRDEMFEGAFACGYKYFNAGVVLWNISALRGKITLENYLLAATRWNYDFLAPDQDMLNYVHWKEVKYADGFRYNLFPRAASSLGYNYQKVKDETSIIHFVGMKPWDPGSTQHFEVEELWWEYAEQTPFYFRILQSFQRECVESTKLEDYIKGLEEQINGLYRNVRDTFKVNQKLAEILERMQQ